MSMLQTPVMKKLPCEKILAKVPLIRELLTMIRGTDDEREINDCIEKFCEEIRKVNIYFNFLLNNFFK